MWNLGLLGAASAGIPQASAFELLETQSLNSGTTEVIFNNVDTQYAADYQHLQLRMLLQSPTGVNPYMQLNGVTSASYAWQRLYGAGSGTPSATGSGSAGGMFLGNSLNSANIFGAFVTDLYDPFETSKYKAIKTLHGYPGTIVELISGSNASAAAINQIRIYVTSSSFNQNSRMSLYGLRRVAV